MNKIGDKIFTLDDQQRFAALSFDRNPMHLDAIAARRLLTGRPVVHGIHLLLHGIELWRDTDGARIASIECSFNNPVSVGECVVFTQRQRDDHHVLIEARVGELLCAHVVLATAGAASIKSAEPAFDSAPTVIAELDQPLEQPPESHLGKSYVVAPGRADFAGALPRAHGRLGNRGISALAALSYFVGMVCPGLHSIFSSLALDLNADRATADALTFQVRGFDRRVGMFDIRFRGCIAGGIKAFVRPPPQPQPSMAELKAQLAPREFAGTRSLVIGGSRGLGEATAKLLAAGGGQVVITYAAGLADARRVADEINAAGEGTCDVMKLDLTTDSIADLALDFATLDMAYFFATPKIFRKKAAVFEPQVLREFVHCYVERFYELCAQLEASASTKKIKVYFPSSVAVTERPRGVTEYAMAKSAAEVLVDDINKSFKNVAVVHTRLPRLSTDQTATVMKVAAASNVATLLPIVRTLKG